MENPADWKTRYPRHWWALDNMAAGPFRSSLLGQLERSGELSQRQRDVLWEKAHLLEQIAQGALQLPVAGEQLVVKGSVRRAHQRYERVIRISFDAEPGWTGSCDTGDPTDILLREQQEIWIRGTVRVAREGWVAFKDLSQVFLKDPNG